MTRAGAFESLGDELLERVLLACVSRSERQGQPAQCGGGGGAGADRQVGPVWCGAATVPCVAKRWRRVWNTSTLLHPTLALDLHRLESQLCGPADEAALLRLLAQRCAAARRVFLHRDGQHLRMVAVLRLVSPQLQAVYLGAGAPHNALLELHRFPALRSLDVPAAACPEGQLPGFAQSLEELTLREGVSPGLLSALASLPRLRLLSLTLTDALPAGHHRQLAALRSLEELHLYFTPAQPTAFEFQPSALAALTRLRSVLLVAPRDSMCQPLTIGPGMSKLAALQELQVESRVERLPADLWSCLHLTRLDLDLSHSAGLPPPVGSTNGAAFLPALRELRLARCRLQGGALPPALCQLSTLSRLEVFSCGLTSSAAHAGLPESVSRLSQLEHLALEANALCTLPPALCTLPALRHLDLSCNQLAWLPPGPYLRSLETLLLSANRLAQVPPVLADASSLEVLDMSSNPALELSLHDVHAVLSRMPRLSLLLLGKQAALDLPPGVGITAAGMPGGLEWRTPSVAALVALGQALPHLQIDFEHTAKEYEGI